MARLGGIFLNLLMFVFLAGAMGTAAGLQDKSGNTAAPAGGSKAAAGAKGKASDAKSVAEAAKPAEKLEPLAAETTRRIQNEIRARYNVPAQVKISVSEPESGGLPGYDQLVVTFTGGTRTTKFDFLLSKDRQTLAHLDKIDISQDLMSKINLKERPVKGNNNAKVTIVNFDDFQCPFCSRMHAALFANVFKDYADRIRVVYKDYPLVEMHAWAMHAAIDSNCLGEQNAPAYWDFADYVHANQREVAGKTPAEAFVNLDNLTKTQGEKHQLDPAKLQACVRKQDESAVRASMAEGDKLGVDSTPTLFINGERFTGVLAESELRAVLDRALADSAPQAPANAKN